MPDRKQLSEDRWQIFQACDAGLERVEQKSMRLTGIIISRFDDSYEKDKF